MQLKKLQWINRPKKVRVLNSKQLKGEAEGAHEVLYTFSEDCKFNVSAEIDDNVSFSLIVLLSPENEVVLKAEDEKAVSYSVKIADIESKAVIKVKSGNSFSARKLGSQLIFRTSDNLLASFSFPSIKESVSIGARLEGKGGFTLTFNMED